MSYFKCLFPIPSSVTPKKEPLLVDFYQRVPICKYNKIQNYISTPFPFLQQKCDTTYSILHLFFFHLTYSGEFSMSVHVNLHTHTHTPLPA